MEYCIASRYEQRSNADEALQTEDQDHEDGRVPVLTESERPLPSRHFRGFKSIAN